MGQEGTTVATFGMLEKKNQDIFCKIILHGRLEFGNITLNFKLFINNYQY